MDSQTKEHVAVGAILAFVFAPYSGGPLVGAAVAGYLEGPDLPSGGTVGALSGLVALVAVLAISTGDVLLGGSVGVTEVLWEGLYHPASNAVVPLFVLPLIGGCIGAYVHREADA